MEIELRENEILVLRTVSETGAAYGGYQWPLTVGEYAEASDWEDNSDCGHGLHGLPWGEGDSAYCSQDPRAKWLLVAVNTMEGYRHGEGDMTDKCKFRRGRIAFVGAREDCAAILSRLAPVGIRINYATVSGGYRATVSGGDGATVSGGYEATVSGGGRATVSGGNWSTVSGGNWSTVSGGDGATVSGGDGATVTGGDGATVTGGDGATVTGGDGATVSGGYGATVSGGDGATVLCGDGGYQRSGRDSIQVTRWIEKSGPKLICRLVNETMADKWYHVKSGVWTRCSDEKSAELDAKGKAPCK